MTGAGPCLLTLLSRRQAGQPSGDHPRCSSSPGQRSSGPPGAVFPTLLAGPPYSPVQLGHIAPVYPYPAGQEPGAEVRAPHPRLASLDAWGSCLALAALEPWNGALQWVYPALGITELPGCPPGGTSASQRVPVAVVHGVCRGPRCWGRAGAGPLVLLLCSTERSGGAGGPYLESSQESGVHSPNLPSLGRVLLSVFLSRL